MKLNVTLFVTLLSLSLLETGDGFQLGSSAGGTTTTSFSTSIPSLAAFGTRRRTTTSSLHVTVGLGPGELEQKEQQQIEQQQKEKIVYEEPDHELYRQSRLTKIDKQCDAWYTSLLGRNNRNHTPNKDDTPPNLGKVSQQVLEKILTPVELKDDVLLPPSDPQYTAYVWKLRQPGAPIVPAFGCENYGVPVVRRRAEAWRQFDVMGMVGTDYSQLAAGHGTDLRLDADAAQKLRDAFRAQKTWLDDEECAARLVYVNGRFVPSLSITTDMVKDMNREDLDRRVVNDDGHDLILQSLCRLPDGHTDELVGDPEGIQKECGHTLLSTLSAPHHNTGAPTSQFAINNQQGMSSFAALNTIKAGSVSVVDVPPGHREDKPILIVNAMTANGGVSTSGDPATTEEVDDLQGVTHHPRTLMLINEDSDVSVIQTCVDLDVALDDTNTNNAILPKLYNGYTQIFLQKNATLNHSYLEETGGLPTANVDRSGSQYDQARMDEASRPALRDTHLECLDVHLVEDDSTYRGTLMGLGGCGRSKIALTTTLLRPDTHCVINGLSLAGGDQTVDMRTTLHHVAHGTTSDQTQKNMVGGRATATFKGRIRVEQSGQQTESDQLARTLLLSDRSKIWSIPTLEIIADDVKCAHGATVSDLSEEELFYLRSRGIDRATSRNMIMYAFVDSIGQGINERYLHGEGMLKERIVKRLENMVPQGDRAIRGEFQSS